MRICGSKSVSNSRDLFNHRGIGGRAQRGQEETFEGQLLGNEIRSIGPQIFQMSYDSDNFIPAGAMPLALQMPGGPHGKE